MNETTYFLMIVIFGSIIAAAIAQSKGRDGIKVAIVFCLSLLTGAFIGLVWAICMKKLPKWQCQKCDAWNHQSRGECHICLLTPAEVADTSR